MDRVLCPHAAFAAAYLDDVIIHSDSWAQHLRHVAAVLESLRQVGLTANPKKCTIGRAEVRYLGYHLGRGQVRPLVDKMMFMSGDWAGQSWSTLIFFALRNFDVEMEVCDGAPSCYKIWPLLWLGM